VRPILPAWTETDASLHRRLGDAIDPERTGARTYPARRHEQIADAARNVLTDYAALDPAFALPDPTTFDDPPEARRAQDLLRYLTHSFRPFEMLSAVPAADTPIGEVLDTVEDIINR